MTKPMCIAIDHSHMGPYGHGYGHANPPPANTDALVSALAAEHAHAATRVTGTVVLDGYYELPADAFIDWLRANTEAVVRRYAAPGCPVCGEWRRDG